MPKPGDIGIVKRHPGLLDDIISDVTNSPYVHATFFINETDVIEAWWSGVRVYTYPPGYLDVFTPKTPLTQDQVAKGMDYAKSKLHTGYDFPALVGILLEKWFGWLGIKRNMFASKYRVICSELVADIYREMGYTDLPENEDCSVTPADLATWDEVIYSGTN